MKKTLFVLFFVLINKLYGQQVPLYNFYYLNPYLYNPSMAGSDNHVNAFLSHCIQWNDIQGAPVTSILTIEGPVKHKNAGLGLNLFSDVTDISNKIGAYISYSYKLNINENNKLLMGISLGVLNSRIDFSKVIVKDYTDPYLLNQNQQKYAADGNIGFTYLLKKLQVGLTIPQLMGNSIEYSDNNARSYYNLSRHFLTSVKYVFNIGDDKSVRFAPLIMVRATPGAPVQYDINAGISWKEMLWFNLNYKSSYAIGVSAAIRIHNNFRFGYAYDIITNPLSSCAGISNQVMLSYIIGGVEKDSADAKIKKQEAAISAFEIKLKQSEEENKQLKMQIDNLKSDIEKTTQEIEMMQLGSDKLKTDTNDTITALKVRLQLLEDKLKLIISMMGE
ncbi:MAG: PorP/SprF family type IX secretion system membrane protein [Bacteroidetes bacterium]|nr:PorP/SprF family type IX secretion system membrane protein [Bacteroidota bacterium]